MKWATALISTMRDVVGSAPAPGRKDSPVVLDAIGRKGNVPVHVADALQNVVDKVHDYLVVAQQEQTKRAEITRQRDVAIASIEAQRSAFSELLKYTFEERAMVLGKQFEALDHALTNGNVEMVQTSLNSMVAVIQTSPFKTVQEMQQALGSKDFVVRLE